MESNHRNPTPKKDDAHWILFSVQSIDRINENLSDKPGDRFPQVGEEQGVSASLVWTGIKGCNTPSTIFRGGSVGMVINPDCIEVPQADTLGYGSQSMLAPEVQKRPDSLKFGFFRPMPDDSALFKTNLAKYQVTENEGKKETAYLKEGDINIFAENVWRKYFKEREDEWKHAEDISTGTGKKIVHYNEAIVFHKPDKPNPIIGLMLFDIPSKEVMGKLNQTLINSPSLTLSLYNPHAEDHIVRTMSNADAQTLLGKLIKNEKNTSFTDIFNNTADSFTHDISGKHDMRLR